MFQIDTMSRTPVYEQIETQLEKFILNGVLKAGEQLPSVRNISVEHSINPRTVLKAYSDLDQRGLITAVPGRGYFVCENALGVLNADNMAKLELLKDTLSEMAIAGVPREEVLKIVDQAFDPNNKRRTD